MRKFMSKKPEKRIQWSVAEMAQELNCPFVGDGKVVIRGVASLENAGRGDLVFLAGPQYRSLFLKTQASAAIVLPEEKDDRIPLLLSKTPHLAFIEAIELIYETSVPPPGIHPQAAVSPSAKIGDDVSIGAFCVVDKEAEIGRGTVLFPHVTVYPRVRIGKDCLIHSQVSIREDCILGNNVILHCGAVIGADGFGYVQKADKTHVKIPQLGTVVIEDDVEVGANTTIDRAALDKTVIRKGTKIDNLVQIAHSVEIGENSIIMSQVGIAGSSKIGKNVLIAGQAGIPDHVRVGDNSKIAAKTGVLRDLPPDSKVMGSPHMNIRDHLRAYSNVQKIPEILKEVKKIKARIK
jgi:UDP-3-O-[3-hydroxymyristoyl] glucosamine N-acyltransferase